LLIQLWVRESLVVVETCHGTSVHWLVVGFLPLTTNY
jgi:hypothetical protein